jgi:ABC-type branched-subunit amino acid transport system substrate-binding protein
VKRVSLALAALALAIAPACGASLTPLPTVKIALVAPFEGRFAAVGYEAFPAMRIALRKQIAAGGIGGYQVEFVAYNDNADPVQAARMARNVVLDTSVVAVIGHYRLDTTLAALAVYTQAGLPVIAPGIPADLLPEDPLVFRMGAPTTQLRAPEWCRIDDALRQDILAVLPDLQSSGVQHLFAARVVGACFATDAPYPRDWPAAQRALSAFPDVSGGFEPGPRSISAYDATRLILDALQAAALAGPRPGRAEVARALGNTTHAGLLGPLRFDQTGTLAAPPVWVYRFDQSGVPVLVR